MKAKFLPISEQHYQDWVEQQGNKAIVTLLWKIEAEHLYFFIAANFQLNIDKIVRLSGRISLIMC